MAKWKTDKNNNKDKEKYFVQAIIKKNPKPFWMINQNGKNEEKGLFQRKKWEKRWQRDNKKKRWPCKRQR